MTNTLLLLAEGIGYFGLMALLFAMRGSIGSGVFMCALAVMHFLETYLASVFYVAVPYVGILSPGSTVLFAGKLAMLLLLYIKEDAAVVRQPIYGLAAGNVLMMSFVFMLRFHDVEMLPGGTAPDMSFIDEMGLLMAWGTTLLFVDAILLILIYEQLGRLLPALPFTRIALSLGLILTFDQIGFFSGLHLFTGAPISAFYGGWIGKMAAALLFSMMTALYLRWFERGELPAPRGLVDVFGALTFRERYLALVERAGRDALTGLMHRGRFDELGECAVANAASTGQPLNLLLIDVDLFKSINDTFGHAQGDRVLKMIAGQISNSASPDDMVFRIGGEEFAVLSPKPHQLGRLLGETIRQSIALAENDGMPRCSVSIGVASASASTRTLSQLFALADQRLYLAKHGGRNRVVGDTQDLVGQTAAS